jgi:hypothetical protein
MHHARKNKLLAERLAPMYNLVLEQLLPCYLLQHVDSYEYVNNLQHLVFLLTTKVQQSFQTSVVRACLDQNLALKALE